MPSVLFARRFRKQQGKQACDEMHETACLDLKIFGKMKPMEACCFPLGWMAIENTILKCQIGAFGADMRRDPTFVLTRACPGGKNTYASVKEGLRGFSRPLISSGREERKQKQKASEEVFSRALTFRLRIFSWYQGYNK